MSANHSLEVVVVVELDPQGHLAQSSLCAVTFARELCKQTLGQLVLCAPVESAERLGTHCGNLGASRVIALVHGHATPPLAEELAPELALLLEENQGRYLIAAATSFGKDLMPRVAGLADCAFVGDCCGVALDDEGLKFLKPIHAGNAIASCRVSTKNTVLTIRQSEFQPARADTGNPSPLQLRETSATSSAQQRVRLLGFDEVASVRPSLLDARVIVSGGRALSNRFFEVLSPLATLLGAAIGATRAACDTAHVPSDLQIGQTGKVVAPELYFAIGLSGSVQHIAGMRGSRVIIAINIDREAPIFALADYGLVGDLFHLVPALVEALRKRQAVRPA